MLTISITLGRITKDLLYQKNKEVSYYGVSFRFKENRMLFIHNVNTCAIEICLPADRKRTGCILEMMPNNQNILSIDITKLEQEKMLQIHFFLKQQVSILLSMQMENIFFNKLCNFGVYEVLMNSGRLLVKPQNLGIAELAYFRIKTDSGIEVECHDVIYPTYIEQNQIYLIDLAHYGIKNQDKLTLVQVIFNLNYNKKECKTMGILSALLSGGALIGKLCQAATSALGKTTYIDKETNAVFSDTDLVYDNLKFYIKKDSTGKTSMNAFNMDTEKPKILQYPVNNDGSSLSMEIKPEISMEVGTQIKYCNNPSDTLGVTTIANQNSDNGCVLRFRVKDLIVGKASSENNINGYIVKLAIDGVVIEGGNTSRMKNFRFTSASGVEISYDQIINNTPVGDVNKYNIPFDAYGIVNDDILSGIIAVEVDTKSYQVFTQKGKALLGIDSETLCEDDARFLISIGAMNNNGRY